MKYLNTPKSPLPFEKKREILDQRKISKDDFIRITDLPKKLSLKLFNAIRADIARDYEETNRKNGTQYQLLNDDFLPAHAIISKVRPLQRFLKENEYEY